MSPKGKTNWEQLRARRKEAPVPTEQERKEARDFWAEADVIIPEGKTRMTVRFDTDVVEWFRKQGPRFQTRMNAVLRQFMNSQVGAEAELAEEAGSRADRGEIAYSSQSQKATAESSTEYLHALNQLGQICLSKGDLDGARNYFEEAVESFRREREMPPKTASA